MDDLISRQAAINAIDECYCGGGDGMIESIMFGIFFFSSWIAIISLVSGIFAHAIGI